jgi:hypothetical protein
MKSLRSRLLSRSGPTRDTSAPSKDVPNDHSLKLATYGSKQPPRRNNYYELTDTMLLETRMTIQGDPSEVDHHSESSSTQSRVEQAV